MPPDNTRPPRNLVDPDRVRATMTAVEELARARGIEGFRTRRGEHVVALIFPSQGP